jgi:hypothetical protein
MREETDRGDWKVDPATRTPEYEVLLREYRMQCAGRSAFLVELDLPFEELRRRVEKGRH